MTAVARSAAAGALAWTPAGRRGWLLLGALLCCGPSLAVGVEPSASSPQLRLSGFGTLGLAWFSNDAVDYTQTGQGFGPGRSRTLDWGLDSVLAVQADVDLGHDLAATAQLFGARDADGDLLPELRLAHLSYRPHPDLLLRVGRLPNFLGLASAYRRVNLANPWPRPPGEVYGGLTGLQTGVDLLWESEGRGGQWFVQAGWFESDNGYPRSNSAGEDVVSSAGPMLSLGYRRGGWTFKAGVLHSLVSLEPPAVALVRQQIAQLDPEVAETLGTKGWVTIGLISAAYEDATWWLLAEARERRIPEGWARQTDQGAYVTVGRHFGNTMPYLTLGYRNFASGVADLQDSPAYPLIAALAQSFRQEQYSLALGVRQTLTPRAVLKLQAEWLRPWSGAFAVSDLNADPAADLLNDRGTDVLLSLSLDFVF